MAIFSPKFTQFHPRVYTRGHTIKLHSCEVVRALQDIGVRQVFNVAPKIDAALQAACGMVGIGYRHEPLSDGCRIDRDRVRSIVKEALSLTQAGASVLVHCRAGRNRTALIVVPLLARLMEMSAQQALNYARGIRPTFMANEHFEKFVLEEDWHEL